MAYSAARFSVATTDFDLPTDCEDVGKISVPAELESELMTDLAALAGMLRRADSAERRSTARTGAPLWTMARDWGPETPETSRRIPSYLGEDADEAAATPFDPTPPDPVFDDEPIGEAPTGQSPQRRQRRILALAPFLLVVGGAGAVITVPAVSRSDGSANISVETARIPGQTRAEAGKQRGLLGSDVRPGAAAAALDAKPRVGSSEAAVGAARPFAGIPLANGAALDIPPIETAVAPHVPPAQAAPSQGASVAVAVTAGAGAASTVTEEALPAVPPVQRGAANLPARAVKSASKGSTGTAPAANAATATSSFSFPWATQAWPASNPLVATGDVNIHSAPAGKSDSIGVLKAGTRVMVTDCESWCQVTVDGKTGWVYRTFLVDPDVVAPR